MAEFAHSLIKIEMDPKLGDILKFSYGMFPFPPVLVCCSQFGE